MKLKHFAWWGALVVCVLVLAAWTAWLSGQHHFHPMPKNLTTPPDVDRSKIPLGPYTANFSGLIGGPTGDKRVTFYVVMRPGDVHLQHVGEVGRKLDGSSVIHVGIRYLAHRVPPRKIPNTGIAVNGLRLREGTINTRPQFHVPGFEDAAGQSIWIICSLFPDDLNILNETHSFRGVSYGTCTATFRPRLHLHAFMGGIPPKMMPRMAVFLPNLYQQVSNRIHGEP